MYKSQMTWGLTSDRAGSPLRSLVALSGSQWTEPEMLEESLEPLLALAGLLCKALCETRKEIPFFLSEE